MFHVCKHMWHLVNCETQMKFYELGSPGGDAGLNCKSERGQDLEKLSLNTSKNEKRFSVFHKTCSFPRFSARLLQKAEITFKI